MTTSKTITMEKYNKKGQIEYYEDINPMYSILEKRVNELQTEIDELEQKINELKTKNR